MDYFNKIISFEYLYKAHRRARFGKRHKREVIEFEMNLSENIWKLHYDLKYNKYEIGNYYSFMIYDPKPREIQAISYSDRIVQHSLCDNYLMPLLERRLISDNVACRKKKGTAYAIKRIRYFLCNYYKNHGSEGYILKLDISKYFDSINHGVLKEKLSKLKLDERILDLLCIIIDSYQSDIGKGLPMGNQTSQAFALLYLDNVDRYIKEKLRIKYYLRYMDDMFILFTNKNKAKEYYKLISKSINENKLYLNPKSQIIPLKNGFDFLGWHFKLSGSGKIIQTVKRETKKRIIKKCKVKVSDKNISKEQRQISYQSYEGLIRMGKSYTFLTKI